ncbi:hypothetical protein CR513_36500, partial [Mucuna pruriens]
MARFLHGLNREIQDIVELHHYSTLEDLVLQATKVECKLKRKLSSINSYPSSSWKDKEKEKDRPRKDKSPKKGSEPLSGQKKERAPTTLSSSKSSNIKCFKENGEVESESFQEESTSSSEVESSSDHSHYKGDLFMVRRLMSNISGEKVKSQMENIFHSRCLMLRQLCSIIIDGAISVNMASSRLVGKLRIPTLPHHKPYKWEIVVDKQVSLDFTLRKYVDEVMCDMMPTEAIYILLGKPWQFDRKVIHDGVTNRFSFEHMGQKVVLKPLSPMEVCEDQIKMRIKREDKEKKKRKPKRLERKIKRKARVIEKIRR